MKTNYFLDILFDLIKGCAARYRFGWEPLCRANKKSPSDEGAGCEAD